MHPVKLHIILNLQKLTGTDSVLHSVCMYCMYILYIHSYIITFLLLLNQIKMFDHLECGAREFNFGQTGASPTYCLLARSEPLADTNETLALS